MSIEAAGLALTAAALWGTTGTAQHMAPAHTSPYWVGALRLGVACVFFAWVIACLKRAGRAGFALPTRCWAWTLAAGICIAVYNLTFFAGVKASGVALGTVLAIGSGPVWANLLQSFITRQAPLPAWWVGTLLAVAGAALLLAGHSADQQFNLIGLSLCLAAGLAYASYTLISQKLISQAPPATVTLWTFSAAAVIAIPVAATISGPFDSTPAGWGVVLYLGLVSTGLAYLLFSHALRHLSAATGVTLALAEPLTAFALAVIFLGERPGLTAWAGLGLVLLGLALVIWIESRSLSP